MVRMSSLILSAVCVLLVSLSSLSAVDVFSTGVSLDKFTFYGDARPEADEFSKQHAQFQAHLKTGTTIVGICCRDGIVLGADTRSTGGPLVMDKNKLKIHTIAHKIRCCAAGTSADCDQITRKARHFLGLVRIEHELAGENESDTTECVQTAVTHIANTIQSSLTATTASNSKVRKVQSVLILGGVDAQGPALYQIDAEGVPQRIGFGALGSGATDALAILEHARRDWLRNSTSTSTSTSANISTSPANTDTTNTNTAHHSNTINSDITHPVQHVHPVAHPYRECIDVHSAVSVVRRAVQAGILNDLGSGSHVDLCVITADEVRQWRETLVSSWDTDRLPTHQNTYKNKYSSTQESTHENAQAYNTVLTASVVQSDTVAAATNEQVSDSTHDTCDTSKLGRRVFSRMRPISRLIKGTVQEVSSVGMVDGNLAFNIEQLTP